MPRYVSLSHTILLSKELLYSYLTGREWGGVSAVRFDYYDTCIAISKARWASTFCLLEYNTYFCDISIYLLRAAPPAFRMWKNYELDAGTDMLWSFFYRFPPIPSPPSREGSWRYHPSPTDFIYTSIIFKYKLLKSIYKSNPINFMIGIISNTLWAVVWLMRRQQ